MSEIKEIVKKMLSKSVDYNFSNPSKKGNLYIEFEDMYENDIFILFSKKDSQFKKTNLCLDYEIKSATNGRFLLDFEELDETIEEVFVADLKELLETILEKRKMGSVIEYITENAEKNIKHKHLFLPSVKDTFLLDNLLDGVTTIIKSEDAEVRYVTDTCNSFVKDLRENELFLFKEKIDFNYANGQLQGELICHYKTMLVEIKFEVTNNKPIYLKMRKILPSNEVNHELLIELFDGYVRDDLNSEFQRAFDENKIWNIINKEKFRGDVKLVLSHLIKYSFTKYIRNEEVREDLCDRYFNFFLDESELDKAIEFPLIAKECNANKMRLLKLIKEDVLEIKDVFIYEMSVEGVYSCSISLEDFKLSFTFRKEGLRNLDMKDFSIIRNLKNE